ncbi:MAG TPA: amidohydrolase family protein, partial [Mycobacterium sp.]
MAAADLVITGTVLTVDDTRPTAEAMAVADGRIVAVGDRSEMADLTGPNTQTLDIGHGCVMPGFIEAHGHPLMEAIALSDRLVDIRPVTMRNAADVVEAVRSEVNRRGPDGAYLLGWDALLQPGLPEPTLSWLNEIAPDDPLVIIHNSGHKAFFNSCAAQRAGLNRDTADPKGAKFGRDAHGDLDGTAEEAGAVFPLLQGAISPSDYPAMLLAECARLNRAGLTTCSEMAFDPALRPLVDGLRGQLTVRLRTYEMSNPQMSTTATPGDGDDVVRQVGIKIWVDGSP